MVAAGYEFLGREEAPDTVNPALWRHARVNMASGLFKVVDRVYQVRGLDLSNMTIIEGDTGLIVIDPLVTARPRRRPWTCTSSTGRGNRCSP